MTECHSFIDNVKIARHFLRMQQNESTSSNLHRVTDRPYKPSCHSQITLTTYFRQQAQQFVSNLERYPILNSIHMLGLDTLCILYKNLRSQLSDSHILRFNLNFRHIIRQQQHIPTQNSFALKPHHQIRQISTVFNRTSNPYHAHTERDIYISSTSNNQNW